MFYLNLCTSLMHLALGRKKKKATVVQCCVNNTEDAIKLVLMFTWNNQFVVSYQSREIGKYA